MHRVHVLAIGELIQKKNSNTYSNPDDVFNRYDNVDISGIYCATGNSLGFKMSLDLINFVLKLRRIFINNMVLNRSITNLKLFPKAECLHCAAK